MTTFAQRLRGLIDDKGISYRQIASEAGVEPSSICRLVNNLSEPKFITAIRLADYFGVSLDYLAGRDGP